uniref:RNA helicase n=1 Tax=Polyandrocarpa misakiensis TaxID=7723 RepID=Q1HA65_POLMI|nr:Vasa [Polyandrocarpa misakiensis]
MFQEEDDWDDFGGVETATKTTNKSSFGGFGDDVNSDFAGSSFSGNNSKFNGGSGSMNGGGDRGGGARNRSCFKCGQEGHMSRDCTSGASGDTQAKKCFKCGEEGHMSRDCPSNTSTGSSKACFKCGEEGHMSRECPNNNNNNSKACFKCGEEGHMSRECPNNNSSKDGFGTSSRACFKCGEEGHMSRECPKAGEPDPNRPPLYIPPPPSEDEEVIFASMQTGINFNKYDSIPVEVTGMDAPNPIANFDEANLPETICANVKKAKYSRPTPVQKYSIPIINADRDLMSCAQTGSGKTAAFLLPVLSGMFRKGLKSDTLSEKQTPQAIVVGPTRELVLQIFLEARKFAYGSVIRPVVAYGGTSVGSQLRDLCRGCNILIATPGRLLDFINRGKVSCECVEYLILDEADRMLDMGFEPEIRRLLGSPGMPDKNSRHTLMFSATFPNEIQKLAHEFLRDDFLFLSVGRVGGACSDVTQTILQVDEEDKRETLMQLLSDVAETRSRTLVFVETKRKADFLAAFLSQENLPTTSIHGDRYQREREMALADFKSGTCPIMIATSVAARGLDIPKVEHVINFDLPNEIDEFVHRVGRTGRCGNLGQATSFYSDNKDGMLARSLVKVLADAQQEVPEWLESCAESAIGTSFGPKGGQFGARDARNKGRGQSRVETFRSKGDYDYADGGSTAEDQFGNAEKQASNGFGEDDDEWE